ncbi:MAG TPA: alpha/beta fold hydrolase, partial [Candidatus Nitrosocosmicus sp.]|nr:alpha/beta fold hydrolase [Candidatus Nitrosocosmicus sp.]
MVTFVLVHGTGHGGWCWRLLTPLLRAAGYDVYAPTLTGLGASSHLLEQINKVTLDTHVTDILNLLFYEDLSEVVLLGHSYGGMVITGVAKKESRRLSHLIYLDAYLPLEGENEIDLWPAEQKQRYYIDLEAGLNSRAPMPSSMLGITDSKMSDWVQERLTPHPYSTYEGAPISSSDNGIENNSIPRTFIHCTSGPLS